MGRSVGLGHVGAGPIPRGQTVAGGGGLEPSPQGVAAPPAQQQTHWGEQAIEHHGQDDAVIDGPQQQPQPQPQPLQWIEGAGRQQGQAHQHAVDDPQPGGCRVMAQPRAQHPEDERQATGHDETEFTQLGGAGLGHGGGGG
ncbi:MAG: hypothetical protein EBX50_19435, partial [Chitinophagia bacterium]|nr:hypothetical protein [Chitinophagia bacterium]